MKYRIIKQTDGFGVERIYAQVQMRILFFFYWLYLNCPDKETGNMDYNEQHDALYTSKSLCTEENALALIKRHRENSEREKLENVKPKIEVLKTFQ